MDAFHERLILRAATIDELLSDEFETAPDGNGDADLTVTANSIAIQSGLMLTIHN